jgi:tetratricopeptide (TPR) repeat protein
LLSEGRIDEAKEITENNIWLLGKSAPEDLSRCHCLLGDIKIHLNDTAGALEEYEKAVEYAKNIFHWPALIISLTCRGTCYLKSDNNLIGSRDDLETALSLAQQGGYRIYEADIHARLAELLRAESKIDEAKEEAELVLQMSEFMDYEWGKMKAREILQKL